MSVLPPNTALQFPVCALSPRLQRRSFQCTAVMPSALRHQPHSWSDDSADLSALHHEVIETGPIALKSKIKVSRSHMPWQADLDLGMSRRLSSSILCGGPQQFI